MHCQISCFWPKEDHQQFIDNNNHPPELINFFSERGINKTTIIKAGVYASNNAIVFPQYFNGELYNEKFRSLKNKKFWQTGKDKGGRPIFFNLDNIISDNKPIDKHLIIVEGEIDAMSWIEVGENMVISVPQGANDKPNQGGKIDHALQLINPILAELETVYLACDNDAPGKALANYLAEHIGPHKCRKIDYPTGMKDSNDVLVKSGRKALLRCKEESTPWKMEGVIDWDAELEYLYQLKKEGLPELEGLFNGEFDEHLKIAEGGLTVVTGIPGHGKSALCNNIALRLAVKRGWKFAYFIPETLNANKIGGKSVSRLSIFMKDMTAIAIGKPMETLQNYQYAEAMSYEEYVDAVGFIKKHFFIIKSESSTPGEMPDNTLKTILKRAEYLRLEKGINALVIDPFNRVHIESKNDRRESIGATLNIIDQFRRQTGIYVFIVAHPRKMEKNRKVEVDSPEGKKFQYIYSVPGPYDISGASFWYDMMDHIICPYRNTLTGTTEVWFHKVKNTLFGKTGNIEMGFSPLNNRFYHGSPDNSNWLHNYGKPINNTDGIEVDF